MNDAACRTFNEGLRDWLDSSWDTPNAAIPASLEEHAANCPECRRALTAARRLLGRSFETPAGLDDAVLARIATGPVRRRERWLRPLAAAAAVLLMVGLGLWLGLEEGRQEVTVQLTLNAPQASSVSVVGDWNGWDPTFDRMVDPDEDGVWEIELTLQSGEEHMYQFVIDQSIRTPDPLAVINIDDGFGSVNSVLNL
jgi:hypothetical protein